ncbi:hypothetical protein LCGC14_0583890 [marine sediment metagenome]|uniref:Glycosyltransferase 2-like domain-containing protein n=1 Tax=marine sediment metagenome TaxID=412755 RepID=A0A0F9UNW9_9ZZZZ
MSGSRVTVVVPAYNAEEYLEDCLRSVEQQSFSDFVCKVYDDGSQDRTREIVRSFAERDSRFQLLTNGHLGTPGRVAQAYREVASEFFCQVDADDRIVPEALSMTLNTLEGCPKQVGVVYSDYLRVESDGAPSKHDPHFEKRCRRMFSLRRMQQSGLCAFQFRMMRKSAYDRTAGVNPTLPTAEDFDLVIKLAETCQFVHIPQKLYEYRQHELQTSRRNTALLEDTCKGLMRESIQRLGDPALAVVIPYDSPDALAAVRGWCSQVTSKPIVIAAQVTATDADLFECKEYSHQRVELIPFKEGVDVGRQVSMMLRGARTISLEEPLVPTAGVAEDLIQGRAVPVLSLEPRSSWLLQQAELESDVVTPLAYDSGDRVGDGDLGSSVLIRLSREEIYCE